MPALPYLRHIEEDPTKYRSSVTAEWTHDQIAAFVFLTYTIIFGFAALIVLAVMNMWHFVVVNGKCKVSHPLFVFYILAILSLLSAIGYTIMFVELYCVNWPFILLSPICFKCMLGIEQVWMMVALIIRINKGLNVLLTGR